jgi:hypothetical protein
LVDSIVVVVAVAAMVDNVVVVSIETVVVAFVVVFELDSVSEIAVVVVVVVEMALYYKGMKVIERLMEYLALNLMT